MIESLYSFGHTLAAFIIVLSIIVFIHEYGHYIVAKLCGVKIETFSIGFGKELFGWNDKSGTRWKVSLLPLGGYVKMFGDATAASTPDSNLLTEMTAEERNGAFHYKPLYQKMLVVVAGPAANFLLTIAIFIYFIMSNGLPSIDPVIGKIMPDSAAFEAGLQVGDRVTMIDKKNVYSFNDISYSLSTNLGTPVAIDIVRGEENMTITMTPKMTESDDGLGNKITRPLIGVGSGDIKYEDVGAIRALGESVRRTYMLCESTIRVMGQMITGKRGVEDLKGPVGIAQLSGQAANKGTQTVLWLIAVISANLGLMNLLPVPVLDGGHLVYYSIEALRGRPLAQRIQEYGFRVGFALLIMLMGLTLLNDLRKLI
ncbi:MAG: RIP metalloprotease RseP [Rickettsiales bacterium]|jgi:regulator of sigma E protease